MLGGSLVAVAGAVLAVRTPARVSGALFVLTGVSMALAGPAVAHGASATWAEIVTLQVAGLALMAYPRLTFPDPATSIAALVVIALPRSRSPGVLTLPRLPGSVCCSCR